MHCEPIYLEASESQSLLSLGNSDAAMLYLYLRNGNDIYSAKDIPGFTQDRLSAAIVCLQKNGMYHPRQLDAPAKMQYGEQAVLDAAQSDMSFQQLTREVQHRLGKALNTEELKILLNMRNYLGLPADVICILVNFIVDECKRTWKHHSPSMYQIEKAAYRWTEMGIDSMESALQHIQQKEKQHSALSNLMRILQIRGRDLTAPEEKYAQSWLQMGMSEELLQLAYERTCLNTGGMSWSYMDAILRRWKEAGYRTAADVRRINSGNRGGCQQVGPRQPDADELAAIQRMLQSS